METIGTQVYRARRFAGYTITEASRKLNMTRLDLKAIESDVFVPTLAELEAIAKLTNSAVVIQGGNLSVTCM